MTATCNTCGFTPKSTTGRYPQRAMSLHSCAKHLAESAARQRRLEREAAVDRTPKPCVHPVADHQHGSRAAYVLDRCRCLPCAAANSQAESDRERQKAYGRYDVFTDAEPVRAHLAELASYGIGLKTVSKISGVSNGALTKIVYGRYASVDGPPRGRYDAGDLIAPPARRVKHETAARLLAVQPVPENLPATMPDCERSDRARLQLRALVALGWSIAKVGEHIGMTRSNFGRVIHGTEPMTRGTVDKAEALYSELSMTLPPADEHRQKISVSRARRLARTNGWLPPLDLEAVLHQAEAPDDAVDIAPELDDVAIERRMAGDKDVRLTKAEAAEAVARWHRTSRTWADFERTTGINADRYPAAKRGLTDPTTDVQEDLAS